MTVPAAALALGTDGRTRSNNGVVVPLEAVEPITGRKGEPAIPICGNRFIGCRLQEAANADPSGRVQTIILRRISARKTTDLASILQDSADVDFHLPRIRPRPGYQPAKSRLAGVQIVRILPCDIGPRQAVRNGNGSPFLLPENDGTNARIAA